MMILWSWPYPHPTSPSKGEGPIQSRRSIQAHTTPNSSPLRGRPGGGVASHTETSNEH